VPPAMHKQRSGKKAKQPQPYSKETSESHLKQISVDTLIIGSGPAALGFLVNAVKTGRLSDIIRSKD